MTNLSTLTSSMTSHFLSLADPVPEGADDPWQLVATLPDPVVQVYKLRNTDFCFKVVADIHATPETAFDLLSDITRRGEWDDLCEEAGVVEVVDGATKYQFMKTKGIWPAAPRDSLVLSFVKRLPDGRYLNVTQSIVHDAYPPRDADGIVRMEAKIAGQVVGPTPDHAPGMCRVVQVADGDLKGWIPKSVIGFIATKAVPMSFKALDKLLAGMEQRTESKAIAEAEGASRADGEGPVSSMKEELPAAARTATPLVAVPTASQQLARGTPLPVVRRERPVGILGRIRSVLEWWQPYFITVLLVMKIWKKLRERRSIIY
ncbi:hypothetical protein HK104_000919 [Borealophlyctis nickersoniae]|nr:hypothetical protein HK104_000919 [Borealophlyctis nickersoniae]